MKQNIYCFAWHFDTFREKSLFQTRWTLLRFFLLPHLFFPVKENGTKARIHIFTFYKETPFEGIYLSFTSNNRKVNIFMLMEKFRAKAVLVVKISILTKIMKYFQKFVQFISSLINSTFRIVWCLVALTCSFNLKHKNISFFPLVIQLAVSVHLFI